MIAPAAIASLVFGLAAAAGPISPLERTSTSTVTKSSTDGPVPTNTATNATMDTPMNITTASGNIVAVSATPTGNATIPANTTTNATNTTAALPSLINFVTIPNVSAANMVYMKSSPSLVLSAGDPRSFFGKDHLYVYEDVKTALSTTVHLPPSQILGSMVWPNEATRGPASLFGTDGIVIPGGSLQFLKSDGGIWFSPFENGAFRKLVSIYQDEQHVYNRVVLYDVNKDGALDLLTCRVKKNRMGGVGGSELVWLTPKNRERPTDGWKLQVISGNCDVNFRVFDIDGDGIDEIITAEMYGSAITLIQSLSPNGRFDQPGMLKFTPIDGGIGQVYDLEIVDLNADGKVDLLVSAYSQVGEGAVHAYEIPDKIGSKQWIRHTLAVPFPVFSPGKYRGAPGAAQAFHPSSSPSGTIAKPSIVVSGDAATAAYLLTPTNITQPGGWNYSIAIIHTCTGRVGSIAIADANKDGGAELYIPCPEESNLYVYSF